MDFTVRIGNRETEIVVKEGKVQYFSAQGGVVKSMLAQLSSRRFQACCITRNGTWLDEYSSLEEAVSALQDWYDSCGI